MEILVKKYNIPGPRYTSYPTVPFWNETTFSKKEWMNRLKQNFKLTNSTEGISIYIHLPYCESICTLCGCHKYITKRHEVEAPYINALLKEWEMYLTLFKEKPFIKELHLGGGTPTFFSSIELERLLNGIFAKSIKHPDAELSFEGHPNNTTREHLQTLHQLGFTRVSFGVQDYDETVQKAINRKQSFEKVAEVTDTARKIGYTSISHDIIFGLPFQTVDSIKDTIQKTALLSPDRISFYSYAHVPWIKGNGQRGFKDADLPQDAEKRLLYETGRELFETFGYYEIGMDHFAKSTDDLYHSFKNNTLHRNFMGYTPFKTTVMVGLGASSIGDTETAFAQNEKNVSAYLQLISEGTIPVVKGHLLTAHDLILRRTISNIICTFQTPLQPVYSIIPKEILLERLSEFLNDDLITIKADELIVTTLGKTFVRNICMAFDEHLISKQPKTQLFSMTI